MMQRNVETTEQKIKEAEQYLSDGNDFHAKKSAEIAFGMAMDVMENGNAVSAAEIKLANTWQARLGEFTILF